jgi:hypothetical protein
VIAEKFGIRPWEIDRLTGREWEAILKYLEDEKAATKRRG